MKKILTLFFLLTSIISVSASELLNIPYRDIKDEGKIKIENDVWMNKVSKKDNDYFVKIIDEELGVKEFYNSKDGSYAFSTGCDYEFIEKGRFIGYSNSFLKFFEFTFSDGMLSSRELLKDEVQELFPEYNIITISEFSNNTNSLKIKKTPKNYHLILLNDTDRDFSNYSFTTGNAKLQKFKLRGFINIQRKGMIQFSKFGDNSKNSPWFILLLR